MTTAAPNSDLSNAYFLPGTYVQLNLTGAGSALGIPQLRMLFVANKTSSGIAAQDSPVLVTGQSDVNLKAGQGSDLARIYAAGVSQVGGGQFDAYILPIVEPSAGTAATRTIVVGFSTGSAAATQDSIELWLAGYHCSTLVNVGDTATVIGGNLAASINAMKDIPWTAANVSGTVTLTYRHKGIVGEDSPVMAYMPNNATSLVTLSPGTITYATAATGAGSATVTIGSSTVTAVIANSDTPTTIAANVVLAINGTNFPVTALSTAGVVTLYFRNDPSAQSRVVQRPAAAIVTTTGTTATVAAGTAGTGTPNLTNALAVLAAQGQFGFWATSFNDTTSLGSLSSHIETYANGVYQKDQFLWAGSTAAIATAGAIPTGSSPALTASGRYHLDWCPDSPQQAYELAARHAAAVCVQSSIYPGYNYDGLPLVSQTSTVPLLLPDRAVRPSSDALNSSIGAYNMTPLAVNEASGQMVIIRGRTTLSSSDIRQWDTSLLQCAAFVRYNARTQLRAKFSNKSIKSVGLPQTVNTISVQNIIDAIIELLVSLDGVDIIDGAAQLKTAVASNVNVVNASRVDAYIPVRFPVPMHQLAPVVALQ